MRFMVIIAASIGMAVAGSLNPLAALPLDYNGVNALVAEMLVFLRFA